jgi:hypothetical protein
MSSRFRNVSMGLGRVGGSSRSPPIRLHSLARATRRPAVLKTAIIHYQPVRILKIIVAKPALPNFMS